VASKVVSKADYIGENCIAFAAVMIAWRSLQVHADMPVVLGVSCECDVVAFAACRRLAPLAKVRPVCVERNLRQWDSTVAFSLGTYTAT